MSRTWKDLKPGTRETAQRWSAHRAGVNQQRSKGARVKALRQRDTRRERAA